MDTNVEASSNAIETFDKENEPDNCIVEVTPRYLRPLRPRPEIKTKHSFFVYSHSGVVLNTSEIKKFESSPTSIKIFSCGVCGRFTQREDDLNKHLETHMNEKDEIDEAIKPPENILIKVIQKIPNIKREVENPPPEGNICLPKIPIVRTFPCLKCDKTFTRKSVLQTHQLIHAQEKEFQCTNCEDSSTFETANELLIREEKQHPHDTNEAVNLDTEDTASPVRYSLLEPCVELVDHNHAKRPKKTVMSEIKPSCEQCGKEFKTHQNLKSHLATHSNKKPYSCNQCGKSFLSKSYLHLHKIRHSEDRPFVCHICGNGYKMKKDLNKHLLIHTNIKTHRCHLCGRAFLFKGTLTKHMLVHSDERPYACDQCGKRFKERFKLKIHMFLHQDIRPHVCEICGKAFRQKGTLTTHLQSHQDHNSNTQRPNRPLRTYSCKTCERSFRSKSYLIKHEMTHQNLKPTHLCDLCGKVFLFKDGMMKHRNMHVQERIFSCDKCDKSFKTRHALRMHKPSHLDTKTQNCELCGKMFKTFKTMRRHMKLFHPSKFVPKAKGRPVGSLNETSEGQSDEQSTQSCNDENSLSEQVFAIEVLEAAFIEVPEGIALENSL